jgi:malate/lactate dehydrogenase
MFEKIFTFNAEIQSTNILRPRKGVIIGLGQVGLACAYSLLIQNCFDELVLQDLDLAKVEGEVMDLVHGMSLIAPTHAYIIGEHGDSEVPVWSTANVAGQKLLTQDWADLTPGDRQELTAIFDHVKNAAYEVIQRKGYTAYAIGLVVTDIVKAILRSQERVLTVSGLVDGLIRYPRCVSGFTARRQRPRYP